jgi:hypothetical protein
VSACRTLIHRNGYLPVSAFLTETTIPGSVLVLGT